MPFSSSKFHIPNPGDNFGLLPECFKCSGWEVLCNTCDNDHIWASSSYNQSFFGPCFWLSDECHDPLRAGAKKVLASKSIFWLTWCSENDCQPSCTLQLHTDVLLFTSSSLKPPLNCDLIQPVVSAYRFGGSICLSFRGKYLSQLKFHISFSMEFQLCRELIVSVAVFHCFSSYCI